MNETGSIATGCDVTMKKLLFIAADDLTGALDTGVQFAARGIPTRVSLLPWSPDGDDAVDVVCTNTRHLPPETARDILRALFASADGHFAHYMKKLDSTLRGNVGSELSGMADALGGGTIHLLNAFPAAGRTTVGGIQYVHGTRLDQTSFATDPFNPIRSASIREITLYQAPELSNCLCIHDAQTDEDIDRAVQALPENTRMLAGCAGLADGLARRWQQPQRESPYICGPLLILCGSLNPVSGAQMDAARAQGIHTETPPDAFLHTQSDSHAAEARRLLTLLTHEPMIIRTPMPSGTLSMHSGDEMAQAMGRLFASLMRQGLSSPVLIVGGDTLDACMRCIGAHTLLPLAQPLPGTALLHMDNLSVPLLSKAGGFGKTDTMIDLILRTKGGFIC